MDAKATPPPPSLLPPSATARSRGDRRRFTGGMERAVTTVRVLRVAKRIDALPEDPAPLFCKKERESFLQSSLKRVSKKLRVGRGTVAPAHVMEASRGQKTGKSRRCVGRGSHAGQQQGQPSIGAAAAPTSRIQHTPMRRNHETRAPQHRDSGPHLGAVTARARCTPIQTIRQPWRAASGVRWLAASASCSS